jgi:hypothetical protein
LDHELLYDSASTAVVIDVSVFYMGRKHCRQFPGYCLGIYMEKLMISRKKKSEYLVPQKRNCLNISLQYLVTGF